MRRAGRHVRSARRHPAALVLAAAALALGGCGGGGKRAAPPLHLALGDSLAVGVQPDASGTNHETAGAYPARVVKARQGAIAGLALAQYACGGATTGSVIAGGQPCAPARVTPYAEGGSQLTAAEALLRTGRVKELSIDVGGNDLNPCLRDLAHPDQACLARATATAVRNAGTIARRLRNAGGSGVTMVFVPIADPFLAAWLAGTPGARAYAQASIAELRRLNDGEARAFAGAGFRVAPTLAALRARTPLNGRTAVLAGHGSVPIAVQRVCALTWACTPPPRGPNVHLNDVGAEAFARAVLQALK